MESLENQSVSWRCLLHAEFRRLISPVRKNKQNSSAWMCVTVTLHFPSLASWSHGENTPDRLAVCIVATNTCYQSTDGSWKLGRGCSLSPGLSRSSQSPAQFRCYWTEFRLVNCEWKCWAPLWACMTFQALNLKYAVLTSTLPLSYCWSVKELQTSSSALAWTATTTKSC